MIRRFLTLVLIGTLAGVSSPQETKPKTAKTAPRAVKLTAPLMGLCYSKSIGSAIPSRPAQELIRTALAGAPAIEKPAQPALFKAGVRFLIGHAYADELNDPARALPGFNAAGAWLDKACFTLPSLAEKDQEGGHWLELRKAWLDYVEKGIRQKNDKQIAEAEGDDGLLTAGIGISKRDWLVPQEKTREDGKVVCKLEALYPGEYDPALHYKLPFLMEMQVFRLTVINNGPVTVLFNSDDVNIEGEGAEIPCLSPDEVTKRLYPPAALQQFIYFEQSPVTFSDIPFRLYNEALVYCNRLRDALMSKAADLPNPSSGDAGLNRWYKNLDDAVSGIRAGMEETGKPTASISYYRNEAEEARKAEKYGTSHYFNAMASKEESEMDLENGFSLIQRRLDEAMTAAVSRQSLELREAAGKAPLPAWENSAYYGSVRLELLACKEVANAKVKEFFEADLLPPLKGSGIRKVDTTVSMGRYMNNLQNPDGKSARDETGPAVRVNPRSQWKGFLVFDPRGSLPGEGNLVLMPKVGNSRVTLMFPLQRKSALAIRPPLLSYLPRYVESGAKWGKVTLASPVDWIAFMPVLSFQK